MTSKERTPSSICQEQREDYLFGMMSPVEEEAFENHASSCDECSHELALFQTESNLLTQPIEPVEPVSQQEHRLLLDRVFQQDLVPEVSPIDTKATTEKYIATPSITILHRLQQLWFGSRGMQRVAWVSSFCLLLLFLTQPEHTTLTVAQHNTSLTQHSSGIQLTTITQLPSDRIRGSWELQKFDTLSIQASQTTNQILVQVPEHSIDIQVVHNPESFFAVSQVLKDRKKRSLSTSTRSDTEGKSYTFVFQGGALVKSQEIKPASDLSVPPQTLKGNVLAYHKPRRLRR